MGRKSGLFAHSISSPDARFAALEWKSQKVSGLVRKYSRFVETIGGDGFDQDCRPTVALQFTRLTEEEKNPNVRFPHILSAWLSAAAS